MQDLNERTVLGAALGEPGIWLAHSARVTPALFQAHRNLADAICELTSEGKPTDPQSVASHIQAQGAQVKISALLEIQDMAPMSAESLGLAVQALIDAAKRQEINDLGNKLRAQALDPQMRVEDLLAMAAARVAEIGAQATQEIKPMSAIIHEVISGLGRPRTDAIKTGIPRLDRVSSGLKPGELVVLGARPSMGKTALAMGFVRNAAQAGKTVVIFTLEMTAEQICHRLLADLTGINLARIATHQLSTNDFTVVTNAANTVHGYKIFVGETGDNMGSVCRQVRHQHGLDLVVVDYLQLLETRARSREQEIATISRRLKVMARQLDCPVLVLSQLNRQIEQRAVKRPQLADLRESGAIEQDADIVMLLWRSGYYDDSADQTDAELIVAKHRNGPIGTVKLHWHEQIAKFTEAG